jgi:hypothetical protein
MKNFTPGEPTPTNKVHFACFGCRKSFKQQGSSNWDDLIPKRPFPCPNCKKPMVRLGKHFKAPRTNAIRAWREVVRLYQTGERFDRCRPTG